MVQSMVKLKHSLKLIHKLEILELLDENITQHKQETTKEAGYNGLLYKKIWGADQQVDR
jgi:hypothetical protein